MIPILTCPSTGSGLGRVQNPALDLMPETRQKSHLFSKIDDVNVDFLLLKTLCQFHQLQRGDTAALAWISAPSHAQLTRNQTTALRMQSWGHKAPARPPSVRPSQQEST